jgi:glycosyltransferase involved in cell wall biosynthesis
MTRFTDSDATQGIIRDKLYHHTHSRDMRRQWARRLTHYWQAKTQQQFSWPQWGKVTQTRQTLSICIITMNAAQRIEPVLKHLRPLADELVIGIDSKTTDNTLALCKPYADECFMVDNPAATCNGGLKDLVSRCHGDWVLRLDDDELMVPDFERFIPALMAQTRFTHFKIPRLHLCGFDPLMWVDDGYLWPDYQLRLFKNDGSLLRYPPPVGHVGIECDGPRGRLPSLPMIHLNLAINDRSRREAKLRKYIDRHHGQWVHPVNETCLLYEDFNYRVRPYRHGDTHWLQTLQKMGQAIKQGQQVRPADIAVKN